MSGSRGRQGRGRRRRRPRRRGARILAAAESAAAACWSGHRPNPPPQMAPDLLFFAQKEWVPGFTQAEPLKRSEGAAVLQLARRAHAQLIDNTWVGANVVQSARPVACSSQMQLLVNSNLARIHTTSALLLSLRDSRARSVPTWRPAGWLNMSHNALLPAQEAQTDWGPHPAVPGRWRPRRRCRAAQPSSGPPAAGRSCSRRRPAQLSPSRPRGGISMRQLPVVARMLI